LSTPDVACRSTLLSPGKLISIPGEKTKRDPSHDNPKINSKTEIIAPISNCVLGFSSAR
jgi:hypothetical protein